MKHVVTIVQNEETTASFLFPDKPQAMAKFHTEMAYAHSAGVTTMCSVMSTSGSVVATDKYTAPPASVESEGGDVE